MTNLYESVPHAPGSASAARAAQAPKAIGGAVTSFFQRLARAYRYRRDIRRLMELDDRLLKDLGISRSEIRDAVTGKRSRARNP